MATIGGGVGYHNLDFGKTIDGVNANAFATFYATEDLAIEAKFDFAQFKSGGKTIDGWSIGGEAEYLLRDIFGGGSSVFIGGRYSEFDGDDSDKLEHAQFVLGFRTYFMTGGSLANHHRTNTVDNTNTLLERVPFGFF